MRSPPMVPVARPLMAAALLVSVELGLVMGTSQSAFGDDGGPLRYLLTALSGLTTVTMTVWALASAALRLGGVAEPIPRRSKGTRPARAAGFLAALAAAMLAGVVGGVSRVGAGLTIGASLVVAVLVGPLVTRLVRAAHREEKRVLRPATAGLAALAVAALIGDSLVLNEVGPAADWGLASLAVASALLAAAALPTRALLARRRGPRLALTALGCAAFLVAPFSLHWLWQSPTATAVVERRAPLTGKFASSLRRARGEPPPALPADGTEGTEEPSPLDLEGRSVLLVTVDSLRADRLATYGGDPGLTPQMDQLAQRSAVFVHAYAPTPDTGPALRSLLLGTWAEPALRLTGEGMQARPTMPELLREAGYQTAGFFPASVFWDARDRAPSAGAWGFVHVEEGDADARRRVEQVRRYLSEVAEDDAPVFAWVHFVEPHEPYEPPESVVRESTAEGRYEGEVALVDRAVGELVSEWRRLRPGGTVILTADHGEELGDHGGQYHGTTLYQEQVRVPLLWASPGMVEPKHLEVPVEILDIPMTILAAAGIEPPPRMLGDDLRSVLGAVTQGAPPKYAFATLGEAQMATDGRFKAICRPGPGCRLYDLEADPSERHDVAGTHPDVVRRLRSAISEWLETLVEAEVPETRPVLARAQLGDATAGPDLLPLLDSPSPEVRIAAIRALSRLGHAPARDALARKREEDPDEAVRQEAAIAGLILGDPAAVNAARELVRGLRERPEDPVLRDRVERAALALASVGDAAGERVLVEIVADPEADEGDRAEAISALGNVQSRRAIRPLVELLDDERLRILAADALGRIGDRRAGRFLAAALEEETYPPARVAEAEALVRLGDTRAEALVRRYLGGPERLPSGVELLLALGELSWPTGQGADLRVTDRVREGTWECSGSGCAPGEDAVVVLPRALAPRGPARAVFRVVAGRDGATLSVDGQTRRLRAGPQEEAFDLPPTTDPRRFEVRSEGPVEVVAVAVVDRREPEDAP